MLFSEPKIPHNTPRRVRSQRTLEFQCSSASRKFLTSQSPAGRARPSRVSVLFSEPKIPHTENVSPYSVCERQFQCSSASRKFLNEGGRRRDGQKREFQCSSASRKFLNFVILGDEPRLVVFQCSSASRKFLTSASSRSLMRRAGVSVLFSEPKIPHKRYPSTQVPFCQVSVLFSEPKIPHVLVGVGSSRRPRVSVLFSEPKIPQPTLAPASIHISDRDDHASSFLSLPGASP